MKLASLFIAPLIFLLLVGCDSETKAPAVPAVATTDTETRITGTGSAHSPTFRVGLNGTFKAYFKAASKAEDPNDPSACPLMADLVKGQADMGYLRHLSKDAKSSTDMPGMLETTPFHLEAQKYAVDVDTPCNWQVVLQRQVAK